uniref:Uncharacterized protein n=1 Tax=Setaria viridis TaxID=4556 RepID=A0A4U6UFS2_SETVI|nr:hypothetical protein SEVIR_5G202300v2 [Setaria viridis]
MNAMVDSITDVVETAILRGHHAGGLRRYMLQGAVRRALHDIHHHRTPPRRFHGIRTEERGGHHSSPRPESMLQFAPGVCPTHVRQARGWPFGRGGSADAATAVEAVDVVGPARVAVERRQWHHGRTPWGTSALQQQRCSGEVAARLRLRHQRRPPAGTSTNPVALLRRRGGQPPPGPAPYRPPAGEHPRRRVPLLL